MDSDDFDFGGFPKTADFGKPVATGRSGRVIVGVVFLLFTVVLGAVSLPRLLQTISGVAPQSGALTPQQRSVNAEIAARNTCDGASYQHGTPGYSACMQRSLEFDARRNANTRDAPQSGNFMLHLVISIVAVVLGYLGIRLVTMDDNERLFGRVASFVAGILTIASAVGMLVLLLLDGRLDKLLAFSPGIFLFLAGGWWLLRSSNQHKDDP
jgi:hypothetical protein